TMKAPREKFDIETTGTIYIDQVDLAGGDTVEQPRVAENDSTAEMKRPSMPKELDVDLDQLSGSGSGPEIAMQTTSRATCSRTAPPKCRASTWTWASRCRRMTAIRLTAAPSPAATSACPSSSR